jgi:hypothetical protein
MNGAYTFPLRLLEVPADALRGRTRIATGDEGLKVILGNHHPATNLRFAEPLLAHPCVHRPSGDAAQPFGGLFYAQKSLRHGKSSKQQQNYPIANEEKPV